MKERCDVCGWVGTESEKANSGLSELKGPGFCPECGAQDFVEWSAMPDSHMKCKCGSEAAAEGVRSDLVMSADPNITGYGIVIECPGCGRRGPVEGDTIHAWAAWDEDRKGDERVLAMRALLESAESSLMDEDDGMRLPVWRNIKDYLAALKEADDD
jgi:hypothetical protein